jgi:chemotaxis protein CheD
MNQASLLQDQTLKQVVGVADMKVSANSAETIITYALGSCLGITAYDPVARVGGMLHVMLPNSAIDPVKGREAPFMFVDTGLPLLLQECRMAGARVERLVLKVAGGACARVNEEDDYFQIGKKNFAHLRKIVWQNGLALKACEVGGNQSRTMSLEIATGKVLLKVNGITRVL